jgi:hypothetical protein
MHVEPPCEQGVASTDRTWGARCGSAWSLWGSGTSRPVARRARARRGRLVAALGQSYSQIHGNIRPTLWRSDAGAPLREVEQLRELFGGGRGITMDGLVAAPQAFLATGAYLGPDGNVAVHVWRSTNGADWVRLPSGPAQSSTAAEQLLPRDIEPAPQARCSWALVPGDRRRRLRRCRLVRPGGGPAVAAGRPVRDQPCRRRRPAASRRRAARRRVRGGRGGWVRRRLPAPLGRLAGRGPLVGWRPAARPAELPGGGAAAATVAGGRTELWVSTDGRSWTPEMVPGRADRASGVVLGAGPARSRRD